MSMDLLVTIPLPVAIGRFLQGLGSVLSEMLEVDLSECPGITVTEIMDGGRPHELQAKWITAPLFLSISIDNSHTVELMVIRYADVLMQELKGAAGSSTSDPADFEVIAEIAIRNMWRDFDRLKWLLAAACAIALARESNSQVIDASLGWTPQREQSPDQFFEAVKQRRGSRAEVGRVSTYNAGCHS